MKPFPLRLGPIVISLLLLLVAALAEGFAPKAIENTVTHFFVLVVLVVGVGIYVGNTGIISFGHTAFMGIGAYLTAILVMPAARKGSLLPNLPDLLADVTLSPVATACVVFLVVGALGLVIGLMFARLGGASASIATIGLLIIVHSLLVGGTTFTRGAQAIYGVPKVVSPFIASIAAIITVIAADWFKFSRWGLMIRAVRDDEAAAAASGISISKCRALVFGLSVAFTALGGVLFAMSVGVFSPKEFYFTLTFSVLAMLIVGGGASTSGAVLGTVVIVLLTEALRRIEPGVSLGSISLPAMFGLTTIGTSLALILTLYKRPNGLFGLHELTDVLPFKSKRPLYKRRVILTPATPSKSGLAVAGLTKIYGGVTALDDVTLTLERGEILGLIGPNGSGKSTFLSCASGIQTFDKGSVSVDGVAMVQANPAAFAHAGLGRTFQNIRLFDGLSVEENIAAALVSVPAGEGSPTTSDILERMKLADVATHNAVSLSYGQQRRLEIARALALCPRYLLLDEPAAGMNSTETDELADLICSLRDEDGLGILLVDHDLPMILRLSNRVAVLNEGHLIAVGTPDDIRENPKVTAAYFGDRKDRA
jgi:branched-chain amino acid transport system permease protein